MASSWAKVGAHGGAAWTEAMNPRGHVGGGGAASGGGGGGSGGEAKCCWRCYRLCGYGSGKRSGLLQGGVAVLPTGVDVLSARSLAGVPSRDGCNGSVVRAVDFRLRVGIFSVEIFLSVREERRCTCCWARYGTRVVLSIRGIGGNYPPGDA